jgi:hypothetical protein
LPAGLVLDDAAACDLVAQDQFEVVQVTAGRDRVAQVGERQAGHQQQEPEPDDRE